jgi:spore coat protein CotH
MKKIFVLLVTAFFMLVLGCRSDDVSMPALSSAKAITVFSLNGVDVTINETEKTIEATMLSGTDVKALIATFTTTGASVKVGSTVQISGITTNNFTSSVTYTVTAADASTQDYIVTVKVAPPSAKAITAFSLNGVVGTIHETEKTIAGTMFSGTDVKALIATFTTTGASVKVGSTVQISGITTNDFTSSVTYTVTAADASTQDYIVTVKVAPPLYLYILKWFWTNWNKY